MTMHHPEVGPDLRGVQKALISCHVTTWTLCTSVLCTNQVICHGQIWEGD